MILSEIIASFVDHRQAIGMRFRTEARTLKSFCRYVGDRPLPEVTADRVLAFLAGPRPGDTFLGTKAFCSGGLLSVRDGPGAHKYMAVAAYRSQADKSLRSLYLLQRRDRSFTRRRCPDRPSSLSN